MDKITFKKQPKETGLRAIGNPYPDTDIKLNGKIMGYINAPSWNSTSDKWIIRFSIIKKDIMEDGNKNCEWKWVRVKKEFDTENDARNYINKNIDWIIKLNLYYFN